MVCKKGKRKEKKKEKKIFFLLFFIWEKHTWNWEKRCLFLIGNGTEIRPLEMGRKSPVLDVNILPFEQMV